MTRLLRVLSRAVCARDYQDTLYRFCTRLTLSFMPCDQQLHTVIDSRAPAINEIGLG